MTELHIPPETFAMAARVKALRAQLKAAKVEVDRVTAELDEALEAFRPLKAAALTAFFDALSDGGDDSPNHTLTYKPPPPYPHRRADPPKAA